MLHVFLEVWNQCEKNGVAKFAPEFCLFGVPNNCSAPWVLKNRTDSAKVKKIFEADDCEDEDVEFLQYNLTFEEDVRPQGSKPKNTPFRRIMQFFQLTMDSVDPRDIKVEVCKRLFNGCVEHALVGTTMLEVMPILDEAPPVKKTFADTVALKKHVHMLLAGYHKGCRGNVRAQKDSASMPSKDSKDKARKKPKISSAGDDADVDASSSL